MADHDTEQKFSPASGAAPFRFRRTKRLVIGHGWGHKLTFLGAPLLILVGVVWTQPIAVRLDCETLEGAQVRCALTERYLTHADEDAVQVSRAAPAHVESRDAGSDKKYFLCFPNGVEVRLSHGHAQRLSLAVNEQRSSPAGTRQQHEARPWIVWLTLVGALGFMLFGVWAGRTSIVELDPDTGAVRVLQSAVFGPPREIARLRRGEITGVRPRTTSSGKSTRYAIDLETSGGKTVRAFSSTSPRRDTARELAEMLGVTALGAR